MGRVYRAHDSRLQRSVAIKVLHPGQDLRRFEREARTLAALSHPNIVPIFDVGHDGDVDYLVEDLVEGESLRDVLRRGPLSVARFRHLAVQIAEGLAAAHRAGIIHRDLKPENIMVMREDFARILDFGLAYKSSHRVRRSRQLLLAFIAARRASRHTRLYVAGAPSREQSRRAVGYFLLWRIDV
jgi:serine/threonine protein kinase